MFVGSSLAKRSANQSRDPYSRKLNRATNGPPPFLRAQSSPLLVRRALGHDKVANQSASKRRLMTSPPLDSKRTLARAVYELFVSPIVQRSPTSRYSATDSQATLCPTF